MLYPLRGSICPEPFPNSINLPCSLFLYLSLARSLARSCNRDQNDAQRQEIGNANVARSRRHEPGNWCFSNSRAIAVLTLPVRIRNAVDPSRRLAGSEILSKYSPSPPRFLPHPGMTSLLERWIWLRTSALSIAAGGSLFSFSRINPYPCASKSYVPPFLSLSIVHPSDQRDVFTSDNNASYRACSQLKIHF